MDRLTAGRLDRRITLQQMTVVQNPTGEADETWTELAQVWAQKHDARGDERLVARVEDVRGTTTFTIRHRTDVAATTTRIVYAGEVYDIESVAEIGRREGLEISTLRAV